MIVGDVFSRTFFKALLPPEKLLVSEWADKYRVLSSKASAEPGKWLTSRTPYLKAIMDELSPESPIQEIVVMKGSQVGFTECGNNWLGYIIDHCPAPTLVVWPTIEMVKKNSKIRIDPLIESNPRLKEKITVKKTKDSDNTIAHKGFPGGYLALTGSNSASGLKSLPCRFLFLDEVDEYPGDVGGQGDPINLAKQRAKTFSRRKIFMGSTPTTEFGSRINIAFQESDRRYFHIPCPECGHYQKLEFKNLRWDKGNPETVLYYCNSCGVGFPEHKKSSFLSQGKWIAENPGAKRGLIAGFHLSSLYSPLGWYSWTEAAEEWEAAQKDNNEELTKAFLNGVLGETWKEKGDVPDWEIIYQRRENYKIGTVPDGVVFLTCGVDVQRDRLELEVVGWGRNKESWSIDYRVLLGNTAEEEVWNKLTEVLSETFKSEKGEFGISLTCIDSGFNTQQVYNYCRRFSPNRVRAIKGQDGMRTALGHPKSVDVNFRGQVYRNSLKLWSIGVSVIKSEIYGWLKQGPGIEGAVNPHGYCHFPEHPSEFFKQLTAEQLNMKLVKGFRRYEWEKTRTRNEALDCRVYNRAAASMLGIDRFDENRWLQMGEYAKSTTEQKRDVKIDSPVTKRKVKRKKSSFL